MSVSKRTGAFICFNGACDKRGNLRSMVSDLTGASDYEIMRLLIRAGGERGSSLSRLRASRSRNTPFPTMPEDLVDRLHEDLMGSPEALEYMKGRGFNEKTLREYRVGYSPAKNMISTPMFDVSGNPVGVIGRGLEGKVFRNSVDLPTGRTLWNIHNAKTHDTVIVCEANFDAMRISQAGYPNVVACLGGNFSPEHAEQLERYATFIVIMTDNDDPNGHRVENCRRCSSAGYVLCRGHNPGRKLGAKIADEMTARGRVVRWAVYSESEIYPRGAKDAGDMTEEEIRQCIQNAESNFKYKQRMRNVVV